ncbi:MAG: HlyD family secretion protein [Acidobacteriota bacterium]
MRKIIIGIILVATFAAIAFAVGGCGGSAPATPAPAVTASAVKASAKIIAEGKVVPARSAALSFQTGGIITQVAVVLGDKVEAGKMLAQLDTRQLELQLAQSEANLASAQARLNQLKRGPTPEDLAAAQQNVASAQAAYDNLVKPAPGDIVELKTNVDKAQVLVSQATAAYDAVGGDSNPYSGMLPQRAQVQSAWLDYQRALTAYDTRMKPSNAQIQQALATIATSKNLLAKLQPTADDLAAAQANVNAAQAGRDLVAEQIKNGKLTAPFAGTVTTLDLKSGEFVAAGAPVLRLADPSNFQVETTDLTELNIVSVREGDAVTVSFDAIPNMELPGKVKQIKGYGENRQGDIVYTLVITLDKQDERLRWNMTAKVTLAAKQ